MFFSRLSLTDTSPFFFFFCKGGFIFHNVCSRGPVVSNRRRSEGLRVHDRSARPSANQGTRGVSKGPNGILMFISTVDVQGGGREGEARGDREVG